MPEQCYINGAYNMITSHAYCGNCTKNRKLVFHYEGKTCNKRKPFWIKFLELFKNISEE